MDILASGKAANAIRAIQDVQEKLLGLKAEGEFASVDERIDWLEAQASKQEAVRTTTIALTGGTHDNTEIKNGVVQLKELSAGRYASTGVWESGVIDLSDGWIKTNSLTVTTKL